LDTPNWVNKDGDGCDWYEVNDYPGCPSSGEYGGNMGSAIDNCCYCYRVPCENTPNWVDKDGDGCDWYEENDYPGCPSYGNTGGNMGIANENCCHCVN
jgi:hypothetical protein